MKRQPINPNFLGALEDLKPLQLVKPLDEAALKYVYRALLTNGWNQTRTASQLQICQRTIRQYIKSIRSAGITIPAYRSWNRKKKLFNSDLV